MPSVILLDDITIHADGDLASTLASRLLECPLAKDLTPASCSGFAIACHCSTRKKTLSNVPLLTSPLSSASFRLPLFPTPCSSFAHGPPLPSRLSILPYAVLLSHIPLLGHGLSFYTIFARTLNPFGDPKSLLFDHHTWHHPSLG